METISPSSATPRTSDPFCSLLILSISSSPTTSLNFVVLEDFKLLITTFERKESENLRFLWSVVVLNTGKLTFRPLFCRDRDDVEAEAIGLGELLAPSVCLKDFLWRVVLYQENGI